MFNKNYKYTSYLRQGYLFNFFVVLFFLLVCLTTSSDDIQKQSNTQYSSSDFYFGFDRSGSIKENAKLPRPFLDDLLSVISVLVFFKVNLLFYLTLLINKKLINNLIQKLCSELFDFKLLVLNANKLYYGEKNEVSHRLIWGRKKGNTELEQWTDDFSFINLGRTI